MGPSPRLARLVTARQFIFRLPQFGLAANRAEWWQIAWLWGFILIFLPLYGWIWQRYLRERDRRDSERK